MPRLLVQQPEKLRPYLLHGLDLQYRDGDSEATCDCPFCGREGKFSVNIETGLWGCFICAEGTEKGGGNAYVFLRHLWKLSDENTKNYSELAERRRLLNPETLMLWETCQSLVTGEWLVPGYSIDGKLCQLYKYVNNGKRWLLMPTPTLGHRLHGVNLYDPRKSTIYLCEGPWDGMLLWETLAQTKLTDSGLAATANVNASLLGDASVLAVPGCNVFQENWVGLFAGKRIVLMYDNDHPRQHPVTRKQVAPAGLTAMQRIAKLLSEASTPPASIEYLSWGKEGWEPELPSGWDITDALSGAKTVNSRPLASRIAALKEILGKVTPIPSAWIGSTHNHKQKANGKATPPGGSRIIPCTSWKLVVNAWRKAMLMRSDLEDVLCIALAVCLSTEQIGDQLFLQMIGDAGSGKTRFCDAMLTSSNCYALEHLTGFHSGWKDESGEDYSLLSRINHKTLITPEGDVLISSPHFPEIMSQQRRIFDGTSGASYKNRKEDLRYTGLRTPWIIAGTPALMDTDQSRLGDRFLRVCISPPAEDEKQEILRRVGYTALRSVIVASNGDAGGHVSKQMAEAYGMTGGYVDYLFGNATELLSSLQIDEESIVSQCSLLAEFTADMRARPDPDHRKEHAATKELPTRLTHQFVRLACCLAVVLNQKSINEDVLLRVRKVAMDTGRGRTLALTHYLYDAPNGLAVDQLALYEGQPPDRTKALLQFLKKIHIVELFEPDPVKGVKSRKKWRLTERMRNLFTHAVIESNNHA